MLLGSFACWKNKAYVAGNRWVIDQVVLRAKLQLDGNAFVNQEGYAISYKADSSIVDAGCYDRQDEGNRLDPNRARVKPASQDYK